MARLLSLTALALALGWAAPSLAQMGAQPSQPGQQQQGMMCSCCQNMMRGGMMGGMMQQRSPQQGTPGTPETPRPQ